MTPNTHNQTSKKKKKTYTCEPAAREKANQDIFNDVFSVVTLLFVQFFFIADLERNRNFND
jgi:NADH:ubiquinone oxidoreductase subunit 3 (subunit A)